jgi:hypothetical protein
MMKRHLLLTTIATLAIAAIAPAQLFSEDFEVNNTANWRVNASNAGNVADFFFDYSTVGIPSAPSGSGTRGMKLESNIPGTGVFSGLSTTPVGQRFTGNFIVRFDAWQNFNGPFPGGGNGSTQVTMAGIGAPEEQVQFPGSTYSGLGFAATGDGGSASDYRVYNAPGAPLAPGTGVYAAGTGSTVQNNTHPYYAGFGNVSAPAAQLALFPQQTGNTAVGTLGMAWHVWIIEKSGNTVTWTVDNTLLATVTNPNFGGENIFFGQFDVNATSSTDPNARNLLFGLIDNIEVVPEPSTLAILGLGALGLIRRRKR